MKKRVLLVFHLNFLRQDRGCSNYIYAIAKSLKQQGYILDFFSANIIENVAADFNKWNQTEHLIDNFYFVQTNDSLFSNSWCNAEICNKFNEIINQNQYEFINIHYIQWSDLVRYANIPAGTEIIYAMQDNQFMQTNYNNHALIGDALNDELSNLQLFDKIMCISFDEMIFWQHLLPNKKFYFLPYTLKAQTNKSSNKKYDILFIGANNPYNKEGLMWFLEDVYPNLDRHFKIVVCGKIVEEFKNNHQDYYRKMTEANFHLIDFCDDLYKLYANVKVSIVPMFRGTGMKIKTIEAMAYGIPIVSTLLGVDGFPDKTESGVVCTNDAKKFAESIIKLLGDSEEYVQVCMKQKQYFEKNFAKDVVDKNLKEIFSQTSMVANKRMPRITIVTVVYNLLEAGRENMFRQCVESVHTQTYNNIEHIVIDGASTDGTLTILKEYQQKGMITYYSEPDKGIYDAMNKGLSRATGEYIGFLNSDDFYHDCYGIEQMVSELQEKMVDFCYSECRYVKQDGTYFGTLIHKAGSWYVHMPFSHQTLFVRTNLMRELGGFDEKFKSAGDYDFILRLFMSGASSCELSKPFVSYRVGGFSEIQNGINTEECIRSFEERFKPLYNTLDSVNLYHNKIVPLKLFETLIKLVSKENRIAMRNIWDNSQVISDDLRKINEIQYVDFSRHLNINSYFDACNQQQKIQDKISSQNQNGLGCEFQITEFKFFKFFPLLKIMKKNFKIKYTLFGFIPLYKHKNVLGVQKWKIFGIPTLKICQRNYNTKQYYLFGVPFMKSKLTTQNLSEKFDWSSLVFDKIDNEFVKQVRLFNIPIYRKIKKALPEIQGYAFNKENPELELNGFSNVEPWGRWSDGNECSICFFNYGAKAVKFDFHPFLCDKHSQLLVKVWINGIKCARWNMELNKEFPDTVVKLRPFSQNRVVFKIFYPMSPQQLNMSNDTRLLGLAVKKMELLYKHKRVASFALLHKLCCEYENNEFVKQVRLFNIPIYRKVKKALPEIQGYDFSKENPELELNGFSNVEPWGRWSDGNECSICFFNYEAKEAALDFHAFLHEKHPSIAVKVYVNGKKQNRFDFVMKKSVSQIVSVNLKPFARNKIVFKIVHPVSPKELGVNQDSRLLGIGMKKMFFYYESLDVDCYKKGDVIEFSNADVVKKGMSEPGKYIKSNSKQSSVTFKAKPDDYVIKLHIGAYNGTKDNPIVDFLINGVRIKTVDFKNYTPAFIELPIKKSLVIKNNGQVHLTFQTKYKFLEEAKSDSLEDNGIAYRCIELCPYIKHRESSQKSQMPVVIGGSAFNRSGGAVVWDFLSEFDNVLLEKAEIHFIRHTEALFEGMAKDKNTQDAVIRTFIKKIYDFCDAKVFPHLQSRLYARDKFVMEYNKLINQIISNPVDVKLLNRDYRFPVENVSYEFNPNLDFDQLVKLTSETVRKVLSEETDYHVIYHFALFSGTVTHIEKEILGDKIKEIAVYRDPRDQYVELINYKTAKNFEHYRKTWVPSLKQLYQFKNNPNLLLIRFEDFVLNYDKVAKQICDFCGLDKVHHVYKRLYFVPEQSKKNIGLWKSFADQKAIHKIEQELPELLWNE